MHTTAITLSGGITTAQIQLSTINPTQPVDHEDVDVFGDDDDIEGASPPRTAVDFEDHELPEWARNQPDKSAVRYHVNPDFVYITDLDRQCGMSYERSGPPDPYSRRTNFAFGLYGNVRAVVIDSLAWCSLEDAARIAGIPTHSITGWLSEDQSHVRGGPGHLVPDGIRDLRPQGIDDTGIRLEALVPYIDEHRRDDPRVSAMLLSAIADIYDKNHGATASTDLSCTDLWRFFEQPATTGQIFQHTFNCSFRGSFRAVRIGTQVWFRVDDISRFTHHDSAILIKMAGDARTLAIPDSMVRWAFDTGGVKTYVRADAVEKFIAAMPPNVSDDDDYYDDSINTWATSSLQEPNALLFWGASVKTTTLHRMLGSHLDFKAWSSEIQHKYRKLLRSNNFDWPHASSEDYPVPLTLARDIAAEEGTFAGAITARLLTEGGYLHRGSIDETADATLERFVGLVPDRHGRVHIRQLWEFSNTMQSFEDWYQGTLMLNHWCEDPPNEHLTTRTWDLLPVGWAAGV